MLLSELRYRGMAGRALQRVYEPSSRKRCGCQGAAFINHSPPCTSSGDWWTTSRGWLHYRSDSSDAASHMSSPFLGVGRCYVG